MSSCSIEKAGHKPQPSQPAGVTGMSTGQLAGETCRSTGQLAGDTSMNSHHHMDNSENINSIQDDNKVLYKLPKSLVEGGIKIQKLLKSSKLLCNMAPSPSSKSRTATRSCSPTGAPSRPPSGTQTSRPNGTSTGAPSDQQSLPSQTPVINDIENDELSEIEIKILKSKLIVDNNLEGLLGLENKIEPSIEDTINSRLEKLI